MDNKQFHNEWFKPKRYIHIGLPLSMRDYPRVAGKVKNKDFVANYAFLPLIHRRQVSHKRKKDSNGIRHKKRKVRHICFASHFDAQIYSYYASILGCRYEKWLEDNSLSDKIVAYRSIWTDDRKSHKGHLHFAKEVIDDIKVKCEHEPVAVIVADISGFFDNLDHVLLKKAWLGIMNCDKLPPDHNNVFRNTTRFSYIDEVKFFHDFLKKEVLCKKRKYASPEIVKKKVNKMCFFRRNNVIAFCDRDRIPEIRRSGLIETGSFNYLGHHTETKDGKTVRKGIPQGLPISAVLANIYMMEFDKVVGDWATRNQILYRRYSDDIALVLPSNRVSEAKDF